MKVGIDVGGTFTDFLVIQDDQEPQVFKVLSTPADPAIGLIDGLREIAASRGIFAMRAVLAQHQNGNLAALVVVALFQGVLNPLETKKRPGALFTLRASGTLLLRGTLY